jgi:hypothetical protein
VVLSFLDENNNDLNLTATLQNDVWVLVTDEPFVGTVRAITAPTQGYAIPWFVASYLDVVASNYIDRVFATNIVLLLWGDVDGNGYVDTGDVARLAQHLSGMDVAINERAANVTSSGTIGEADLLLLHEFIQGAPVGPRTPLTP